MRRYRSLGLMRRSHVRRRNDQRTQAERFVSESQVKDSILYNKLARANPGLLTLQFATDDVDWQLEYFCEVLGKWLKRVIAWIVWLFNFLVKCFLRRKPKGRRKDGGSRDGDEDSLQGDVNNFPHKAPCRTASIVKLPVSMDKDASSKVWRYKQCQPLANRHFLKRKWFLKPETKAWAQESVEMFQRHMSRGFRQLCSGVGKDTKIYVISASPSKTSAGSSSSSSSQIKITVFQADSSVLKSQSQLFRTWFSQSEQSTREVETSFVTPEEMEAILVYLYTLSWPASMMEAVEGRSRKRLKASFFDILEIFGISLSLTKESPFQEDKSSLGEDPFYDSRCFSQSNSLPSCGRGDEPLDFIPLFTGFEYPTITIEGESRAYNSSSDTTSPSQVEDNRNVRRFSKGKFKIPHVSRRIHPETVLPTDDHLRLINAIHKNDFLMISSRRLHNNISVEILGSS